MLPACFHLSERVFPAVKAEAARRLVAQGRTQASVGAALAVSQAMVSKYLARPASDDPLVLRLAQDLLDDMEHGSRPDAWCSTLTAVQDDPQAEALRDLLAAEQRLLAAPPLGLVPQIGMNLARCLPGARAPADVLAYPARLVGAGDRLLRPAAPELGASQHLATRLLTLRQATPEVSCLASVRGGPDVEAAAVSLGMSVCRLPPGAPANAFTEGHDAWHDAGAVGIEPCLYIAGPDAAAVASQILRLASKVTP